MSLRRSLAGKNKKIKEKILINLLQERKLDKIQSVDWVPMPLNPTIKVYGCIPETVQMFASAVYPCVIEFKQVPKIMEDVLDASTMALLQNELAEVSGSSTGNSVMNTATNLLSRLSFDKTEEVRTHKIMFKSGDDLRQDQLVMQMIALMDSLLKKVNVDLKLLTYGILAVGQTDG